MTPASTNESTSAVDADDKSPGTKEWVMRNEMLEQLLSTLDIAIEAFAVCELRRGFRLVLKPVNAIEVHYVLKGTIHMAVAGADPIVCGPGSLIVVPPGVHQSIAADAQPSQEVVAERHCLTIGEGLVLHDLAGGNPGDLRLVCGHVTASITGTLGLLDDLSQPIVKHPDEAPIVGQLFTAMLDEINSPRLGTRAVLEALMKICLLKALRNHVESSSMASMRLSRFGAPHLHKAVAAVMERPSDKFDVAKLAAVAGMSRSAFASAFLNTFALTPMDFVKRNRLQRAAELLRSTPMSVKLIAARAGFASRSHFSHAFKQAYGVDPTAFRKSTEGSERLSINLAENSRHRSIGNGDDRTGPDVV